MTKLITQINVRLPDDTIEALDQQMRERVRRAGLPISRALMVRVLVEEQLGMRTPIAGSRVCELEDRVAYLSTALGRTLTDPRELAKVSRPGKAWPHDRVARLLETLEAG